MFFAPGKEFGGFPVPSLLPHKRLLAGDSPEDGEIIDSALHAVDAAHLADRPFDRLSGGERQRVLIARERANE